MVFEGRVESGTWLFQPRERSTSWNSSSRQETTLRNSKSAGAIVFHPDWKRKKSPAPRRNTAFPPSLLYDFTRLSRSYAERLECVCEMSRIFFLPNMSIKTDESLADAGFSRSAFRIPPYAFLSGMLIRRDQLISPDDYLPGREWVNGSAAAHLLRAPVRTRFSSRRLSSL